MADSRPHPRSPRRRYRASDAALHAFSDPDRPTDRQALVDALKLHATIRQAAADGVVPGIVSGVNKLADHRPAAPGEEADDA